MKEIILSPQMTRLQIEDHETVLAGLERHGYVLPNNCRAGACGECKIKVLAGNFDQGFILDMALSKKDRDEGMGLMCMAKVTGTSLTIDFEKTTTLSKLPLPTENNPYILTEKLMVTKTIAKLRLRPLKNALPFWPGQYITILRPQTDQKRAYSIANTPTKEGEIVLYITKVNEGVVSTYIHEELNPGDSLFIDGPYGTFIGDPKVELPVLCLANGSGLAPLLSLTTAALMRGGFKYPVTILFSAKTKEDLFDLGQIKFLEKKFRNFRFIATLTEKKEEGFYDKRITDLLPQLFPDLTYYSLYIAGSADFVNATKAVALNCQAKEEHIHLEKFISQ